MTGIPVIIERKRLVSGPCWNLNCLNPCPLAVAMVFVVNSSWTHSVFWSVEELVFQACVVVNVKTGGMFLRITQNGETVLVR